MPGVLPDSEIEALVEDVGLLAPSGLAAGQIQPASVDLRLGATAWRVRASFLAQGCPVEGRLPDFAMHRIDLSEGALLEKGCVYLVELQEHLALPPGISAVTNAKSSTGRLDLLTRTITDEGAEFDRIPAGYAGPLYAEICPRSFSVLAREGQRLNQIGKAVEIGINIHVDPQAKAASSAISTMSPKLFSRSSLGRAAPVSR